MEKLALGIALVALIIAVIAYFKKSRTVVKYSSDLTLRTESRIRGIENVLNNYELKSRK